MQPVAVEKGSQLSAPLPSSLERKGVWSMDEAEAGILISESLRLTA